MSLLLCPRLVNGVVTKPREPSPLCYHSKNHFSFREYQTSFFLPPGFVDLFNLSFILHLPFLPWTDRMPSHEQRGRAVTSRLRSLTRHMRPEEQSAVRERGRPEPAVRARLFPRPWVKRQHNAMRLGRQPGKPEPSTTSKITEICVVLPVLRAGVTHCVPSPTSLTGFLEIPFLVLSPLVFYLFSILAHVNDDIVESVNFSISTQSPKQTNPLHKSWV